MDLAEHWLTDPILDAEYKRYKLQAFLHYVNERYRENRLFPYAEQVRKHHQELSVFNTAIEELSSSFPHEIGAIDLKNMMLKFDSIFQSGPEMSEIKKIIKESMPLLDHNLSQAHEMIEELKTHIQLCVVGVLPMNVELGYMLLQQPTGTRVYEYRLSKVVNDHTGSRSISSHYVDTWKRSHSSNLEQIKLELIRSKNSIANPATFGFISSVTLPAIETFLPLAKELAIEALSKNP